MSRIHATKWPLMFSSNNYNNKCLRVYYNFHLSWKLILPQSLLVDHHFVFNHNTLISFILDSWLEKTSLMYMMIIHCTNYTEQLRSIDENLMVQLLSKIVREILLSDQQHFCKLDILILYDLFFTYVQPLLAGVHFKSISDSWEEKCFWDLISYYYWPRFLWKLYLILWAVLILNFHDNNFIKICMADAW